jgi:hypothetical protein
LKKNELIPKNYFRKARIRKKAMCIDYEEENNYETENEDVEDQLEIITQQYACYNEEHRKEMD